MVAVLGRYAARFSVRATDLTLDFNLVWFGVVLALIAAVFLAYDSAVALAGCAHEGESYGPRGARGREAAAAGCASLPLRRSRPRFLLLTGACVLMKTLLALEQTRPPFDSTNVLAVNLPVMSYGEDAGAGTASSTAKCSGAMSALPGVVHVSTGFSAPWRDDRGSGHRFHLCCAGSKAQRRAG